MSRLLVVAASLSLLLGVTVIPALFTIDEASYLTTVVSLRNGRLTLPGADGLKPSDELSFFNPVDRWRIASPPPPAAPPLYSLMALPFSYLGIRGLFAINAIAYFITIVMVFAYASRYARKAYTPWLAAGAFALGGFTIEYAQGLWPHMLAVALCMGAFILAEDARRGAASYVVFASGVLAGLSAGVRYQNIFFAGCLALTVLAWAPRRWRSTALYLSGIAVPLIVSSALNRIRQGSWNPISKGEGYIPDVVQTMTKGYLDQTNAGGISRVIEPFLVFWAKVADFTAHPTVKLRGDFIIQHAPITDAVVFAGGVKKALLQSSPWAVVAIFAMILVWRFKLVSDERTRNELRVISLIVWPMLLMFSMAGFSRSDGLCFNQRYLLEIVPLLAVAFAWLMEHHEPSWKPFAIGSLLSLVVGVVVASFATPLVGDYAIMRVPQILAFLLLFYWLVNFRIQRKNT